MPRLFRGISLILVLFLAACIHLPSRETPGAEPPPQAVADAQAPSPEPAGTITEEDLPPPIPPDSGTTGAAEEPAAGAAATGAATETPSTSAAEAKPAEMAAGSDLTEVFERMRAAESPVPASEEAEAVSDPSSTEPRMDIVPRDTTAPSTGEAPVTGPAGFVLNFENATIADFIQAVAEDLGFAYILSPEVGEGTVTIRMPKGKTVKRSDLFNVLLSVLELNNIVAIDAGSYYKIVPAPEAKFRPIATQQGKSSAAIGAEDQMITQIIPLEYLSPDEILNTLRPLIDPDSTVISHPGSNLVIMTGLASGIKRLLAIIELLDVETAQLELEIFKIKYADVNDIVSVLDRIFSSQRGTSGAASIPAASTRRAARGRQTPAAPAGEGRGSTAETIMIPDERSNSIIVFASRRDIEFIREIIAMLDVNIYVTQKTYIYYVENANAGELASLLGQIYTDSGSTARRAAPARPGAPGAAGGTSIGAGAAGVEGEVRIVADERTNALIIVTAPANYPFVEETIKRLDILPKQVMIDMLIVDMDVRDKSELGIQWTLRSQGDVKIGDDTYYFDGTAKQNASLPSDIGFSYTLFEASRFASFLRAYTQQSKLEVLSNPQITVANNMEAKIDIGNEIPIVTAESTVDTTVTTTGVAATYNRTIQYRATGILLTVTPHINEKRFVNLEVSQEVSNVSASVIAGIDSPVIETRKASTTVVVRDGETLVIGGMMRKSKSPTQTGIPILSKIPIIGRLFGSSTHQEEQTELLIFITPRVIANPEEGAALSLSLKDRLSISHEYSGDSLLLEY